MQLLRGLHTIPKDFAGCAATVGNFDGVHRGHQVILAELKAKAAALSVPSLVIIFEPQPKEFFSPTGAPPRLANFREKCQLLAAEKIDYVLCLPFNQQLRSMTGDEFIQKVLANGLAIKHLIVGDDFRFGCDRGGDYQALVANGESLGFTVQDTATLEVEGERVSSTRIRGELAVNNLVRAHRMLNRIYQISGRVIYGRQLGRTLDTPTANIHLKRSQLVMSGVYCVEIVHEESQQRYRGVANLGVKPSIEGDHLPSLEVHLFDYSGDLYGQHLTVEFLHKIRDERKFDSLDDLKAAIAADKQAAKHYLAARPN